MTACANLDCDLAATHRLAYTGHEYELCAGHAAAGLEWLTTSRASLAATIAMTRLATPAVVVDRPALFDLEAR